MWWIYFFGWDATFCICFGVRKNARKEKKTHKNKYRVWVYLIKKSMELYGAIVLRFMK